MKSPIKMRTSLCMVVLIIFLFNLISGCVQDDFKLDNVEIQEYQGKDLSSVYDFRENSIKGPQYIDRNNYTLKITGLVNNTMNFSYDEIIQGFQSYSKVVTLNCVEGWSVTILWDGILVNDIIQQSNPNDEAKIAIFHAYDGYTTSLPLDFIVKNKILMAYKMNNVTLPAERGFPFQLVAESKWGYKWIKWITEIELSGNVFYEGYWESRGYSNNANLTKNFFDE